MKRIVPLLLALASLCALDIPPVADPVGLGERLALLDYLKEHRTKAPPKATLEELRTLYEAAWRCDPANAKAVQAEREAQEVAQRITARRDHIAKRHGLKPDAALDEAGLIALLHQLDTARTARDAQDIAVLAEADRQVKAQGPVSTAPAEGSAADAPLPQPVRTEVDKAAKPARTPTEPAAAPDQQLRDRGYKLVSLDRHLAAYYFVDHTKGTARFAISNTSASERSAEVRGEIRCQVKVPAHGIAEDVGGRPAPVIVGVPSIVVTDVTRQLP